MSAPGPAVLGLWLDAHAAREARRAFLRTLVAALAAGRRAWLLDLRGVPTPLGEDLDAEEQRWLDALDEPPAPLAQALREAGSLLVLAPAGRAGTPRVLVVDEAWLARTPPGEVLAALRAAGQVVRAR